MSCGRIDAAPGGHGLAPEVLDLAKAEEADAGGDSFVDGVGSWVTAARSRGVDKHVKVDEETPNDGRVGVLAWIFSWGLDGELGCGCGTEERCMDGVNILLVAGVAVTLESVAELGWVGFAVLFD